LLKLPSFEPKTANDMILELIIGLKEVETMGKAVDTISLNWVSVDDRLPERKDVVLTFGYWLRGGVKNGDRCAMSIYDSCGFEVYGDDRPVVDVLITHWSYIIMPQGEGREGSSLFGMGDA